MKRRYLKKWVEVVLAMVLAISLLILGGESETCFFASKLVAMATLLSSGYVLFKYGRIEEQEEVE